MPAFRIGSTIPVTAATAAALYLSACSRPEPAVRHYVEIAPPPAAAEADAGMPATPPGVLRWSTPEGWQESPGAGMRVVTFRHGASECAVTSFPGDTGGIEANLRRWLGQLGIDDAPAELVTRIATAADSFTTEGGFPASIYDFTPALPAGIATSMVAAIARAGDNRVFVKLTGPPVELESLRPAFLQLARSLRHE